ncbi:MAG TPA: efflux RND transporter permease subunit, partial [Dongiaceae bacterium]|nr:efflux RND transporter permease subunit [Dongiaceae bacterium]
MNALIGAALDRSRTVLTALVMLLVAGMIAYRDMPKESDPDVNIPVIYVSMSLEGIAPEDAERLLLRPMEQELRLIEGVKEMRSTAYQGGGNVLLEFDAGFDADKAVDDVRNKVDIAKPELPDEADEPTVHEVNLSLFPVLIVGLSGDLPQRTLLALARRMRDRIETVGSVLEAKLTGDREEVVELVIDPLMLESYGLDAGDVTALIDRNNRLVAAGTLDTGQGRFAVKVPGLFETARDILDMPVKVNGDAVVRIRDVATLRRTFKDPDSRARIDGRPAVALEVSKRTGENIIETIEQVRAAVEAERRSWPPQVEITYSQDRSTEIRNMLTDLQNNLVSAVVLIMVVVVASLGLRSAGLVGLAIPGSFLIGILVLAGMGLTMNIVVLFSLILAVGEVVDGAIVLTEFADRKMTEGLGRREAYALAAQRMAWPIISSTGTTLAVYIPLMFWPGVVGEFMKFIPLTVMATLAASLLMALVFVPALGATIGRAGGVADAARMKALARGEHVDLRRIGGLTGAYVRLLDRALDRPVKVLAAALVLLVGVQWLYAAYGRGVEFFPQVEPENAMLHVHGRGNLSLDERDALLREVEAQILDMQSRRAEFKTIYAVSLASAGVDGQLAEDVIGVVRLEFAAWDRRRPAADILAEVRARTAGLAGIAVEPR